MKGVLVITFLSDILYFMCPLVPIVPYENVVTEVYMK